MQNTHFQASPYYTIKKDAGSNLLLEGPDKDRLLAEPLQNTVLELLIDNQLNLNEFATQSKFPAGTNPLQVVQYIQAFKQHDLVLFGEHQGRLQSPALRVSSLSVAHQQLSQPYHLIELENSDFKTAWEPYTTQQTANADSLTIVVTNDFLDERLQQINQEMIDQNQSWMLLKPFGATVMLSPVLNGGDEHACWECLAHRMRLHRPLTQLEGYETIQKAQPFYTPESLEMAIRFVVNTLENAIDLQNYLHTYDLESGEVKKHHVVKRPQCPVCGTVADDEPIDMEKLLFSEETIVNQDGGFRVLTALETYERYKHHISPVTGIVSEIAPYRQTEGSPLFNFTSGRNLALQSKNMFWLNNHRRSCSGGKGRNAQQAITGALCEAIERYAMMHHGQPAALQSSFAALRSKAIHPNACMNFSKTQFEQREEINAQSTAFYSLVPIQLDEEATIDWTRVYSLTGNYEKYLPSAFCYAQYPGQDERYMIAYPDSNGCAAGNTHAEAVLQGTLELIERDAAAIWWYNKIQRPGVDLAALSNPYIEEMRAFYASQGRSLEVLDITTDIGVPTFVAVSHDKETGKSILFGFGCHLDAAIAVERSIIELNQLLPIMLGEKPEKMDQTMQDWLDHQTIADNPYLRASEVTISIAERYPKQQFQNLSEVLRYLTQRFQDLSLDLYALPLTQSDIGMPVVKMIAPGLRHYWRRTGPGRLYEVSVKMGWLPQPYQEEELNPLSIVI